MATSAFATPNSSVTPAMGCVRTFTALALNCVNHGLESCSLPDRGGRGSHRANCGKRIGPARAWYPISGSMWIERNFQEAASARGTQSCPLSNSVTMAVG